MPYYTFQDTTTEEIFVLEMTIAEREQFLKDNPNLYQMVVPIPVVDPVGIGVTKPPSDFSKYVLGRIKETSGTKDNKLEKRWSIPKEI